MSIFDQEDIDQAVLTLWNFLCVKERPKKSDVIFVFGCVSHLVPDQAAKLFHQGVASMILISGSMGRSASIKFGISECDAFSQELIKQGVPLDSILLERNATNTGENIIFGMKLLRDNGIDPKTIVFVSTPYHSKRCKVTFQLREPELKACSCPPSGDFLDFVAFTKERAALKLVGEIDRLIKYPSLGLIAEQKIPPNVLEATEFLRKNVKE